MIISFSGPKGCGKSTLAEYLVKKGFTQISFADKLRELVGKLYGITAEELQDPVFKESPRSLVWTSEKFLKLEGLIGQKFRFKFDPKHFTCYRGVLQYVGTDILRRHDPNFHVRHFDSKLKNIERGVCDDVRFPNELDYVNCAGGTAIYLYNPAKASTDEHSSEKSLSELDFSSFIVNNGSKAELELKLITLLNKKGLKID